MIRQRLRDSPVIHADETGINIGGRRHWLHVVSSNAWTWFQPHRQRATEAITDAGILPAFTGTLGHDHCKPHYTLSCRHALCNAHQVGELERVSEQDRQARANAMQALLLSGQLPAIFAGGAE